MVVVNEVWLRILMCQCDQVSAEVEATNSRPQPSSPRLKPCYVHQSYVLLPSMPLRAISPHRTALHTSKVHTYTFAFTCSTRPAQRPASKHPNQGKDHHRPPPPASLPAQATHQHPLGHTRHIPHTTSLGTQLPHAAATCEPPTQARTRA